MSFAEFFKNNIIIPEKTNGENKELSPLQHIRDLKDIDKEELVKWATQNWYKNDGGFVIVPSRPSPVSEGWLKAGSSALHTFLSDYFQTPSWKPNDTDLFLFNQGHEGHQKRTKMGSLDIIEPAGDELGQGNLVQTFDLPPCRVGTFGPQAYIISKLCLASIICGGMYVLPEYVREYETFVKVAQSALQSEKLKINNNDRKEGLYRRRWVQLTARIRKYEQRGFTPIYVNTDVFVPSLFRRPTYY